MHHSRHQPETDSDYSNLLSIWDWLGEINNHGPRFCGAALWPRWIR
jgi:hypothetical protein